MSTKLLDLDKFLHHMNIRLPSFIKKMGMRLLAVNRINQLYAELTTEHTNDLLNFFSRAQQKLQLTMVGKQQLIERIPTNDSLLVIANHPTGIAEIVLLLNTLMSIRTDIKILGNFLVNPDDQLADLFIPINPFSQDYQTNLHSLIIAKRHLQSGHCLIIFPAGEVANPQPQLRKVFDPPWQKTFVELAILTKSPIVSVNIQANNPWWFYAAGKVHPRLRTALLPKMLFTQKNQPFTFHCSHPIKLFGELSKMPAEQLNDWLYYLNYAQSYLEQSPNTRMVATEIIKRDNIKEMPDENKILTEINQLRDKNKLLFDIGRYSVFVSAGKEIPQLMDAISIKRERAFREKNLGTGLAYDRDQFDEHYQQIIIWDNRKQQIAGGTRFQFFSHTDWATDFNQSYLSTIFKINPANLPNENFTELGRTFISKSYQHSPLILSFIWRGLSRMMADDPRVLRYIIGVTSLSRESMNPATSELFFAYLNKKNASLPVWAKEFEPFHPFQHASKLNPVTKPLIENIHSFKQLSATIAAIHGKENDFPSLFTNYESLGCHFGQLSIDPNFSNCVDVLSIFDIADAHFEKAKFYIAPDDLDHIKGINED